MFSGQGRTYLCFNWELGTKTELRYIGAEWKLNVYRGDFGQFLIVVLKPSANLSSLFADDRILSGNALWPAIEDVGANGPLLKEFPFTIKRLLNYVGEKLPASPAGMKRIAFQNPVQLSENGSPLLCIERQGATTLYRITRARRVHESEYSRRELGIEVNSFTCCSLSVGMISAMTQPEIEGFNSPQRRNRHQKRVCHVWHGVTRCRT
jgi:hypothetical protein